MEAIVDEYYDDYLSDTKYVYKSCRYIDVDNIGHDYIVILEKLTETITNESRTHVYDDDFADFRGSIFLVARIFDKFAPTETVSSVTSSKYGKKTVLYTTGQTIKPDSFDMNLNNIRSNGIYYYKTVTPAFYSELEKNSSYTGNYISYHDNGRVKRSGSYASGLRTGTWNKYYASGRIYKTGAYTTGERTGLWIAYHDFADTDEKSNVWIKSTYTAGIPDGRHMP
jgi:hypothetical protein